ncbi:MotA/TolQ/ExbB proton channel family protein [Rhodobacteraceae bacterium F11138]|nr:MotA/TolQ/ExbB proton channel family protein [Rhodobacteraceae bacterium F11138]
MTRHIRSIACLIAAAMCAAGAASAQQSAPAAPAAPPVPQAQTQPVAPLQPDAQSTPAESAVDPLPASQTETSSEPIIAEPEPEPSLTEPYFDALRGYLPETVQDETLVLQSASDKAAVFLRDGGPSIWAIAALSVITVAVILWKIWRLALIGAWSKGRARKAVSAYEAGNTRQARDIVAARRGVRSKVVRAAIAARDEKPDDLAREETLRVAKHELAEAATGLRALELIATIAPLLGLLGTVLGMIAAFQALQESGSRADPALLAGGIWEALLTTAAGMAVAIPASAALSWFEAVIDRMRRDIEDAVTRIFVAEPRAEYIEEPALAAE